MTCDHEIHLRVRGKDTKVESTGRKIPSVSATESNWRWARRIEASERIAEAALRKEEAAAINALNRD
jgi:hypothetical protein